MSKSRAKLIIFRFPLPINSLNKNGGLFSTVKIGELGIHGKGWVLAPPTSELPVILQTPEERAWLNLTLTQVFYRDIDILPVLAGLKEGKDILRMLSDKGADQCLEIYSQQNSK